MSTDCAGRRVLQLLHTEVRYTCVQFLTCYLEGFLWILPSHVINSAASPRDSAVLFLTIQRPLFQTQAVLNVNSQEQEARKLGYESEWQRFCWSKTKHQLRIKNDFSVFSVFCFFFLFYLGAVDKVGRIVLLGQGWRLCNAEQQSLTVIIYRAPAPRTNKQFTF